MPKLPRVTGKEALAALRRAGWYEVDAEGGHRQLKHSDRPGRVTVQVHAGRTLDAEVLKSILRQAGLTVEEFRSLL